MRRSVIQVIETEKNNFPMGRDLPTLVFLLSVEIERLNGEVDSWKLRYSDLDRRISDRASIEESLRIESLKVLELKNQLSLVLQENNSYKMLMGNLQGELESWKSKYNSFDFSIQSKWELSERRLKEVSMEVEMWQKRYKDLERAKDREMEELRLTFEARRKSYIVSFFLFLLIFYAKSIKSIYFYVSTFDLFYHCF